MTPRSDPRQPLVELRGLSHAFDEGGRRRTILEAVDLTIPHRQLVALVGRSGAGKSTLLNLLAGLDLPTAGSVRLDGVALETLDERARTLLRRHAIGFVFQFFNLIPTLTVEENLLLPLELSGRLAPAERGRALERLARVGLADRRRSYPDTLSGGEQQRLAIARALAHEPRLILADEPTGNLDPETAGEVLALLEQAVREAGATLVMATHSHTVAGLADRVLAIRDHTLHPAAGAPP